MGIYPKEPWAKDRLAIVFFVFVAFMVAWIVMLVVAIGNVDW